MSKTHNRFGENGRRLTILSVLPRAPVIQPDRELTLRAAIEEVFRIAGADGHAQVVLDMTIHDDLPEFTTEQNVGLRELSERLYALGADGQSAVLRVLHPDDDPFGDYTTSLVGDGADDSEGGPLAALRRFREAVHRLFGGSAEADIPPTVLSLLVGPALGATTPPTTDESPQ